MVQILKQIKEIKQEIHNAYKLEDLEPSSIVGDISYNFALRSGTASSAFKEMIHDVPTDKEFFAANPQNRVLYIGIAFKKLFDVYMTYLQKSFKSPILAEAKKEDFRPKISYFEYNMLPSFYRGIFVPYDDDTYVLNTSATNRVMTTSKKDKERVETLLKRANMLIPVIYNEKHIFVPNSFAANRVNNEQIKTITELKDIFIELSKITLPRHVRYAKKSAMDLYKDYLNLSIKTNVR